MSEWYDTSPKTVTYWASRDPSWEDLVVTEAGPSRPRLPLLLLVVGLLLTAGDLYLVVAESTRGTWYNVNEIIQMSCWLITGYAASRLRPSARIGHLMLVFGLVLAANSPGGLTMRADSTVLALLDAIAGLFFALQVPVGVHLALTYPSGRAERRVVRIFLSVLYPFGLVMGLTFTLVPSLPMRVAASRTYEVASLVAVAVAVVLFVQHGRRATPRQRRIMIAPTIGLVAIGATFALWQAKLALFHAGLLPWWFALPVVELMQMVSVAGLPMVFVIGLMRQRWDEAAVAGLIRTLSRTPARELRPALAVALGDPLVEFGLAEGDTFVDSDGRPVQLPVSGGRYATWIADQAVIVHDRSLCDEPTLIEAVAEAVRVVLENARLLAEAQEHLERTRELHGRLVQAGDSARRRIERDLHDGAQQRMLAAGMTIQLLRRQLAASGADVALLGEAEEAVQAALSEMRDLAHGIHPAVLTVDGLEAALRQLARRSPLPVSVNLPASMPRLPAPVEITAYFVACEALANTVKHARARTAMVAATIDAGRLRLRVTDDGRGGATYGSGIVGLSDRATALGGQLTLHPGPGCGTTVEVDLPCD